jgi:hypothetical protein
MVYDQLVSLGLIAASRADRAEAALREAREAAQRVIDDAEEYGILDGSMGGERVETLAMRAEPIRALRATLAALEPK